MCQWQYSTFVYSITFQKKVCKCHIFPKQIVIIKSSKHVGSTFSETIDNNLTNDQIKSCQFSFKIKSQQLYGKNGGNIAIISGPISMFRTGMKTAHNTYMYLDTIYLHINQLRRL